MYVQWRDVSVDIGGKCILHPCSGEVKPGRMVALMGPSGSGKTTLLSCLRKDIPHRGDIRFDGSKFVPELRQSIGFVEQEDVVIPQITVGASLRFLAELRFGLGSAEATARVRELLQLLQLEDVADTKVGTQGATERISGGQKKRLCIARELLSDPSLLLCDEPTSGLDSAMADQVVESMRRLCDTGKVSVIAAIHQPSTSIFERFDDIILLKAGQVVYAGPTSEVLATFTCHGPQRAPAQSVAEYIMDCLVLERKGEELLRIDELLALEQKRVATLPELEVPAASRHVSHIFSSQASRGARRYEAPFLRQVMLLYRRHAQLVIHEVFTWQTTILYIGLIFVAGLLWWQLDLTDAEVHPRFGACCWVMGTWMFFPVFGSIGTFNADRPVLEKELKVGCYSVHSYYIARTLLTLPIEWAWPVLWGTSVFWMTRLNPSFAIYVAVIALVLLDYSTFQAVGLVIAAANMPGTRAATLAILLITYFFGWSGLLMDMQRLPVWLRWAGDINIFKSLVNLMYGLVTEGLEHTCGESYTGGDVARSKVGCEDGVITTAEARQRMGVLRDPFVDIILVASSLVLCRLCSYILLRRSLRVAIDGAAAGSAADATVLTGEQVLANAPNGEQAV